MRRIFFAAQVVASMSGSTAALAAPNATGLGPPTAAPAASSASASATPAAPPPPADAPPAAGPSAELLECRAQLQTSKDSAADLEKKVLDCNNLLCKENPSLPQCKGTTTTKVRTVAAPTICEMPDGSRHPMVGGSCDCTDETHGGSPDYVDNGTPIKGVRVCVTRAAAFAALKARVATLEKRHDDLEQKLAALQTATGQMFSALYAQIVQLVTLYQNLDRRVTDLENALTAWQPWARGKDAKDLEHDAGIKRAQETADKAKLHIVRVTGLLEVGWRGNGGWYLNVPMGRLEYEDRFSATSLASLFLGAGVGATALHADNTFGPLILGSLDAGVRIHTSAERTFAIDVGATYQVSMMTHSAGYLGMPSQFVGSNLGPTIGIMANLTDSVHLMARCTVGFGPENHLDGGNIAKESPAQPRCGVGVGGTIGF